MELLKENRYKRIVLIKCKKIYIIKGYYSSKNKTKVNFRKFVGAS